jgi:hypothetical protein
MVGLATGGGGWRGGGGMAMVGGRVRSTAGELEDCVRAREWPSIKDDIADSMDCRRSDVEVRGRPVKVAFESLNVAFGSRNVAFGSRNVAFKSLMDPLLGEGINTDEWLGEATNWNCWLAEPKRNTLDRSGVAGGRIARDDPGDKIATEREGVVGTTGGTHSSVCMDDSLTSLAGGVTTVIAGSGMDAAAAVKDVSSTGSASTPLSSYVT